MSDSDCCTPPTQIRTADPDSSSGGTDISAQIASMQAAFNEAIEANVAITNEKTKDSSMLTAAQQRPNG
jgi:hypothetical protein